MIVHYLYRWSSSFLFRCNIVLSYQKPKVRNFVCMYSYIEYNWCSTTFYELLTKKNHVYAFAHYCTLWCSFVWLWSHLVRHSRFRLSGKDARVRSCKGKSSKVRGQRSWSAKIWRQRVKKRRCAVAKAKKRYFYIAYLLRNCALSSSHLHTFAFTFFSLHNLMQVPYLSEICRRCYGVIALNAVWRPSCLL